MKKLAYAFALIAMFFAVSTVKAQPNFTGAGKVIMVKLDPSTKAEARGKILSVLTEGKLEGYIKAEQSYLVRIADDATKIQTAKNQLLSVYPEAQLTVVTVAQANTYIEAQRNSALGGN